MVPETIMAVEHDPWKSNFPLQTGVVRFHVCWRESIHFCRFKIDLRLGVTTKPDEAMDLIDMTSRSLIKSI